MAKKFSKFLRKWRVGRDMIQKQAADFLGVNVRTYQGWEEGKPMPRPLALAELERRIGEKFQ